MCHLLSYLPGDLIPGPVLSWAWIPSVWKGQTLERTVAWPSNHAHYLNPPSHVVPASIGHRVNKADLQTWPGGCVLVDGQSWEYIFSEHWPRDERFRGRNPVPWGPPTLGSASSSPETTPTNVPHPTLTTAFGTADSQLASWLRNCARWPNKQSFAGVVLRGKPWEACCRPCWWSLHSPVSRARPTSNHIKQREGGKRQTIMHEITNAMICCSCELVANTHSLV